MKEEEVPKGLQEKGSHKRVEVNDRCRAKGTKQRRQVRGRDM